MLEKLKKLRTEIIQQLADVLLAEVYESNFSSISANIARLKDVNYLIECLETGEQE